MNVLSLSYQDLIQTQIIAPKNLIMKSLRLLVKK